VGNREPTLRRALLAAGLALTIGLGAIALATGFSTYAPLRALEVAAVLAAGAALIGGAVVLALVQIGGWRDPASEEDFELIVQRAEGLAARGLWSEDGPVAQDDDDDPWETTEDEEFKALVRAAIEELPLEFHRALEHVAIVVSDGGGERHAYGLYQGDTVARDFFHDRIVIFRDTLMRDFGHDPDLLRAQVTRTVRHELAHHLGWGEKGVRGLGL
jgi:predicted Zn-dependent protease with MMP-like domain